MQLQLLSLHSFAFLCAISMSKCCLLSSCLLHIILSIQENVFLSLVMHRAHALKAILLGLALLVSSYHFYLISYDILIYLECCPFKWSVFKSAYLCECECVGSNRLPTRNPSLCPAMASNSTKLSF